MSQLQENFPASVAETPAMIDATQVLEQELPLSYQRPVSQVAQHMIHVERITDPDGNVTEQPRLNRKGRRKAEALERRKFQPATRRLTKHELRELMLTKYEDSLEAKPPASSRRKKKKRATAEVTPAEQKPDTRQRRLAQRATERALQAIGL